MRPTKQETFMKVAQVLSEQSTCKRRKVGAILVNKRHHIISTGYNGNASGLEHCINSNCKGSNFLSGEGLELCEAIHAEQNALLQCTNVYDIESIYVTTPPCTTCTKLLLNTSCKEIISLGNYPHEELSKSLWEKSGRKWIKV
jgi:dCMP deaminase